MSRIGNEPINIVSGVEITVDEANVVRVKGAKGELFQAIHPDLSIEIEEGVLSVKRPTNQKRHRSMHGLYRSLINNMMIGVSTGYKAILELHGIGYRASSKGQLLELSLGYSHPVMFYIPEEIILTTETAKGQPPSIILESTDKELLGQIAAKIKAFRKTEPYKGKGIRFRGEYVRRKEGKTA